MDRQHWQDGLVAALGCWLVASNWLLSYAIPEPLSPTLASIVFWNSIVVGVVAIALGIAALASFTPWEEWADIVMGVWLVASPWVLGFTSLRSAMLNVVICGALIILSAGWTLYDTRQSGHA